MGTQTFPGTSLDIEASDLKASDLKLKSSSQIEVHPESFRALGYIFFYVMVALAKLVTTVAVDEDLSNSALIDNFGYNNICINWDYSPSRELMAMFYPCVELSFLAYLLSAHFQVWNGYKQGSLSRMFFLVDRYLLIVQIILLSWVRMIFVIIADEFIAGHTAGFIGLQVLLCSVAVKNGIYYEKMNSPPLAMFLKWRGKPDALSKKSQMTIHWVYVSLLILATLGKMIFVISIFAGNPVVNPKTSGGATVGRTIDFLWMALAAVAPFFISIIQRHHTPKVTIQIGVAATN